MENVEPKNILISTLGGSWEIIPETLGAFCYNETVDFYGADKSRVEPFRESVSAILQGKPLDELWLISTDQQSGFENLEKKPDGKGFKRLNLKGMLKQIVRWKKSYLPAKKIKIRIWILKEIEDITSKDHVDKFHEMALHVLFFSKVYADEGKRFVSLACGRKTMSADIQDAAYCFGCDMMLHVVAGGNPNVDLIGKNVLNQQEAESVFPVELKPFPPSDLFNDLYSEEECEKIRSFMNFSKWIVESYEDGIVYVCKNMGEQEGSILSKVQTKRDAAKHFYSSFFSNQQYGYDTFPIVYTLSQRGQDSLRDYKIGFDPLKKESDLAWLQGLPKADLHFHLGGSLSIPEIIEVACTIESKVNAVCLKLSKFAKAAIAGPTKNETWKQWRKRVAEIGAAEVEEKKLYDVAGKDELSKILEAFVAPAYILQFKENPEQLNEIVYGPSRNNVDLRIEENFLRISRPKRDELGKVIPDKRDLEPYETLGDLQGTSLLRHKETIQKTMEILFRNARSNCEKYIEVRCSPINYCCGELILGGETVSDALDSRKVVEIILNTMDAAYRAEEHNRVDSSLIFIASRHGKDRESIEDKIKSAVSLYDELQKNATVCGLFKNYFRGFDLAGDESANSPEKLRDAFDKILKDCLSITIHAGETMPVENIWEAVYALNAERVGHGLKLKDNFQLLMKFRDRRIGVELCPSSNYQIVGFQDNYYPKQSLDGLPLAEERYQYPLAKYMQEHIRVCVNTDDPGISRTNITNELLRAARLTRGGLSLWEILSLLYNSFDLAFLPYEKKINLLGRMNREVKKWLDKNISKIEDEIGNSNEK